LFAKYHMYRQNGNFKINRKMTSCWTRILNFYLFVMLY